MTDKKITEADLVNSVVTSGQDLRNLNVSQKPKDAVILQPIDFFDKYNDNKFDNLSNPENFLEKAKNLKNDRHSDEGRNLLSVRTQYSAYSKSKKLEFISDNNSSFELILLAGLKRYCKSEISKTLDSIKLDNHLGYRPTKSFNDFNS